VLAGGMISAFLGPEIVKSTQGWLDGNFYGAAFLVMAGLYLLAFVLLSFMEDSQIKAAKIGKKVRPLGEILRQKNFLLAIMAGAVSYGAMTFVMTATPLQMNGTAGFDLNDTAWIIQSHIIAMYLPSLFTGFLIEKLGLFRILLSGAIILLASSIVSYFSVSLSHYWVGLVLLGLGWNLLFVGATVLLTHTYSATERFKTQAANDFTVFGTQATASFSAGSVLFFSGWERINLIGFSVVLLTFFVLIFQRKGLPKGRVAA
jgi:MFS family permease